MRKVLINILVSPTAQAVIDFKSINTVSIIDATSVGIYTNDGRYVDLTVTSGQAPTIVQRINAMIAECNVRCLKHTTEKLPAEINLDVTSITGVARGA